MLNIKVYISYDSKVSNPLVIIDVNFCSFQTRLSTLLCVGGEFFRVLKSNQTRHCRRALSDSMLLKSCWLWSTCICQDSFYRDLKPENILLHTLVTSTDPIGFTARLFPIGVKDGILNKINKEDLQQNKL